MQMLFTTVAEFVLWPIALIAFMQIRKAPNVMAQFNIVWCIAAAKQERNEH